MNLIDKYDSRTGILMPYILISNEYLFDANNSNISDPNDDVTYAHPAELVSDHTT